MNFIERRKILKKTNSTDLIPVRLLDHEIKEDGKVDVFVPRFKSPYLKRALETKKRGEFIFIHLDETGSLVWQLIDGFRTVDAIAKKLTESDPEKFRSETETFERTMKFISVLYQERYITFRQIEDK